jgi:hypothetical protein
VQSNNAAELSQVQRVAPPSTDNAAGALCEQKDMGKWARRHCPGPPGGV